MAKIDTEIMKTLTDEIETLPHRTTMTSYEVVKKLGPAIARARERGQDLEAIAKTLRRLGVHLAPITVRNYLQRARREAARSSTPERTSATRSSASTCAPGPSLSTPRVAETPPSPRTPRSTTTPTGGRFDLVEDKKDL